MEVGGRKVHPSEDGTKITIVGLTEKKEEDLLKGS